MCMYGGGIQPEVSQGWGLYGWRIPSDLGNEMVCHYLKSNSVGYSPSGLAVSHPQCNITPNPEGNQPPSQGRGE